jgi:ubiquinone/menaquinone biosynthesis C-methylase UbiE
MSEKSHWENVYETKTPEQVSWTQLVPTTSLRLILETGIAKDASIIDVGGGDSNLVDYLLEAGYTNITVLDISEKALERAKIRLGEKASQVTWIVSDINTFNPKQTYEIWHDRAVFHFVTNEEAIQNYVDRVANHVGGYFIVGTFSENGPLKCSGLEIKQYNETSFQQLFGAYFHKMGCFTEDHVTPFDTVQNFIFCSFKRRYSCC